MKIYVCIKHVPDSAATIQVLGQKEIDEQVTFIINPYDEHALTEACKIREQAGGEVIAISLGKKEAQESLRSALAMGADRAKLIQTDERLDPMLTARALKAAMEEDSSPDLILTGRESIDQNGMQTMFRLASLFNFPVLNNVVALKLNQEQIKASTEGEKGARLSYSLRLPCVLGAGKGLNKPRYPTMPDIIKSRKKEIQTISCKDLQFEPGKSSLELVSLSPYQEERNPRQLSNAPEEAAQEIIDILKNQAKVI